MADEEQQNEEGVDANEVLAMLRGKIGELTQALMVGELILARRDRTIEELRRQVPTERDPNGELDINAPDVPDAKPSDGGRKRGTTA